MLTVELLDTNEIAKLAQDKNLCVRDLCELKLGISRTTFYNWSGNPGNVKLYTIESLANSLQAHPLRLIQIYETQGDGKKTAINNADFERIFEDDEEIEEYTYHVQLNYDVIKARMDALSLNINDACKKLGVSRSTFFAWRKLPERVSLDYIGQIANTLRLHPHDLIYIRKTLKE